MSNKAIITVKTLESADEEAIEVVTPGEFYVTDSGFRVEYEETEISGMEGTKTSMIIEDERFELIRSGSTETRMEFERNKPSISLYKTPYGTLTITINTKKLDIKVNENGGTIDIVYTLTIGDQQKADTILRVNIKK